MELPYDLAIPLLVIYLKKTETNLKEYKYPYVHCSIFTITKIWKKPKCPSVDEWIKQLWNIYTMEYYSTMKKKKILPFVTAWIDLENIMLSDISQSEKNKCRMISLMWNLMKIIKLQSK